LLLLLVSGQRLGHDNEWKNRLSNKTASNKDDATYSYDANGNLTAEVVDIVRASTTTERRHFTYDAFNRLISVHSDAAKTTLISEYRYNGLGQRTRWRHDANGDKSVGSTERYHYMYDDRWRVVGVFRDADSTPKESFVYHAAGNAGLRRSALSKACPSLPTSLCPFARPSSPALHTHPLDVAR
jgi:YD repeat-containing protein